MQVIVGLLVFSGLVYQLATRESLDFIYFASIGLIGISVYILAQVIFTEEGQYQASEALDEVEERDTEKSKMGLVLRVSRPFFKRYFSPLVSNLKGKKKIRSKYKRKLATAGLTQELSPDDFFAFKLFLIIGFPVVFWILRLTLEEDWPVSFTPLVALIGFYYPNIWLQGKIQRRQKEISLAMPFSVDMMALAVEVGTDLMAAISKVVEKAPKSALIDEFEILLKEIKIGAPRSDAFRNLSWRVDLAQMTSFCATLIAADSVGARITPILKNLTKEMRDRRSNRIEEEGAKAATKIIIPMIFIMLPAVILMIFAPILVEWVAR